MLCRPDGSLEPLEPFDVATPWWQDMVPVVAGARAVHGLDVTVIRLLGTDPLEYLAEVVGEPAGPDIDDHPLRMPWARPGGVARLAEWADDHVDRTGPAEQIRTWNLSCVLKLPTADGPVWLKAVPPFFGHEGAVMQLLGGLVPPVLATGDNVVLLADVDGEDMYDATPEQVRAMTERWRAVQAEWSGRVGELLAVGVPDLRWPVLLPRLEALVPEHAGHVRELVDAAGDDVTLVHGDFHPGNWRGATLLDWGDCFVGHPLLDHDDDNPLKFLRHALLYQMFLDNIEPSERVYHRADPAIALERARELF